MCTISHQICFKELIQIVQRANNEICWATPGYNPYELKSLITNSAKEMESVITGGII